MAFRFPSIDHLTITEKFPTDAHYRNNGPEKVVDPDWWTVMPVSFLHTTFLLRRPNDDSSLKGRGVPLKFCCLWRDSNFGKPTSASGVRTTCGGTMKSLVAPVTCLARVAVNCFDKWTEKFGWFVMRWRQINIFPATNRAIKGVINWIELSRLWE